MHYIIYKITNIINGKYYIGKHQTKYPNDGYMGSGKLIKFAIKKYGIENFTKEILFVFDNEQDMNDKEKELVVVSEETYNLCEGGKGGFGYINRNGLSNRISLKKNDSWTKECSLKSIIGTKKFFENSDKVKQRSDKIRETKKRNNYIPVIHKGWKHTNECKLQKSLNSAGKNNSQYGTMWITNGQENKKIKKENIDHWTKLGYRKGRI